MRISDWSSDVCSSDLHARQVELIDGLGRRRLRIRIAAERHPEALPDPLRLAIGNMFGAAKGQMFEQMGKAALRLGFEHRTDIHADAERNLPRRPAIVAHGIAQPVRKLAEPPRKVAGTVANGIEPQSEKPRVGHAWFKT